MTEKASQFLFIKTRRGGLKYLSVPARLRLMPICVYGMCYIFILFLFSCATTEGVENIKKAEVHFKLGDSFFRANKLKESFIEFQKAISLNPKDKGSLNALGLINTRFKEYEAAISCYKRALSIDPNYSEAMNNLGVTYLEIEQWDEAIKYFNMALKNPLYVTPEKAYSNLGYALYKKGEYLNAVKTLEVSSLRYPDFPYTFYVLGLVYIKIGKIDTAIDELKKSVTLSPEYMDAHWELAQAYLRVGNAEKAAGHFKIVALSDHDKSKEASKYLDLLEK